MRATDLLPLAIDWLARTYPQSLIVPEFNIGTWGAALLDVAAITETEIIGVEIKGEGDSAARLPLQAALYSKAATRMHFLACPALEDRCFKHIPDAWGRLVVRDGVVQRLLRQEDNSRLSNSPWVPERQRGDTADVLCTAPAQLLQCLWRNELDLMAMRCGVITGKVDVETLRWELAEQVPLKRLRTEVCDALRHRKWHTDRGCKTVIRAADRIAA